MSDPIPRTDESAPPTDDPEIPAPPEETAPTAAEEEQRKQTADATYARQLAVYERMVERGKQRAAAMRAAALAGTGELAEKTRKSRYRQSIFDAEYSHTSIPKKESTTGRAVKSLWRGKRRWDDDSSGYSTTPLPDRGEFYLWECVREWHADRPDDDNEELHVSDVCTHLYQMAHTGTGPLPRLRFMQVQSAEANAELDFYGYMGTKNPTGLGVALGLRPEGSDDYYALLGAANANAAVFMVIDSGHELGISGISGIEVRTGLDIRYYFTPRAQGLGAGSSSSSSSSSSDSSSKSGTSSSMTSEGMGHHSESSS
ncbi:MULTISPECIES: hypothetical protein [unclassified Nocardia]|uniref:hypothetical protein n=1 Tax=unclassified Nocardia TaxID=2637762 RepID=UPI001CE3C4D1|nr:MULTISPECIES: hypothetical protein [unclassified Nocardia]